MSEKTVSVLLLVLFRVSLSLTRWGVGYQRIGFRYIGWRPKAKDLYDVLNKHSNEEFSYLLHMSSFDIQVG